MADIIVRIKAVDEASAPMQQIGTHMKTLNSQTADTGGAFQGLVGKLDAVAGAFGVGLNIGNVISGLKNAAVGSFQLAASIEQSEMAFGTMLGSAEKATAMLKNLQAFADKTPFEFMELQNAAKRMMAYGFAAEQVIPTLTAVGDAAAALGGGGEMVNRITTALGQMNAKGKISGEELRQLAEAGVPALRMLADDAGVTTAEMGKMVENGLVPAEKGIAALIQGMGKDFGGLMSKQAETASGKLSTMNDALSLLGTEMGRRFIPLVNAGATAITGLAKAQADAMVANREASAVYAKLNELTQNGVISENELRHALSFTYGEVLKGNTYLLENKTYLGDQIDFTDEAAVANLRLHTNLVLVNAAYIEGNDSVFAGRAATELLTIANERLNERIAKGHQAFLDRIKVTDDAAEAARKAAAAVEKETTEIDKQNKILKDHADMVQYVRSALSEYDAGMKTNADSQDKHRQTIDELTSAHNKNQAAILAGKGTIIDNTTAIEQADITAAKAEISFRHLNERYANQDNIDKYNSAVSDLNSDQDALNKSFQDGEIDAEKLAKGIEKIQDKQGSLKTSLDNSQMSTEDFNLAVRQHTLDLQASTTKMSELTSKHGEGATAAQLAAGEQAKYNVKLAEAQAALQLDIEKEAELQLVVATRIKEGLLLQEIENLAKDGFTAEELKRIEVEAEALGLSQSEAIAGELRVQLAATALADNRKKHAKDFEDNNAAGIASFAAYANSIAEDIKNKVVPDLGKAEQAAFDAGKQVRELATEYNAIQDKNVTIKITTIREEIASGLVSRRDASTPAELQAARMAEIAKGLPKPPGSATGGPISAGMPRLVGEYGPEIFMPNGAGNIKTNQFLTGLMGAAASGRESNMLNISTVNLYGVQNTSQLFEQLSREARARGLTFGKN